MRVVYPLTLLATSLLARHCVNSHGFICDPPSRNAAWICGYPEDDPKNYDQMALNAGGVRTTYPNYPEPCPATYGVCGDPVNGEQIHAAGGVHDRGLRGPRSVYQSGEEAEIQINITAWHNGTFYMQLCSSYPESEDCFETISEYSIALTSTEGSQPSYHVPVKFPEGVRCDRCVLRWFWVTANSPGLPPEIFINCADIRLE